MIAWLLHRAALRVWLVAEPMLARGIAARARAAAVALRRRDAGVGWTGDAYSPGADALEALAEELER